MLNEVKHLDRFFADVQNNSFELSSGITTIIVAKKPSMKTLIKATYHNPPF